MSEICSRMYLLQGVSLNLKERFFNAVTANEAFSPRGLFRYPYKCVDVFVFPNKSPDEVMIVASNNPSDMPKSEHDWRVLRENIILSKVQLDLECKFLGNTYNVGIVSDLPAEKLPQHDFSLHMGLR